MTTLSGVRKAAIFIAVVVGVYALKWAQDLLMPCAMAFLLADVLGPAVNFFTRRRVPNALAVGLVTSALSLVAVGGILLISAQVLHLSGQLPDYRDNILQKVRAIRSSASGPLSRLTGTIREVQQELAPPTTEPTSRPGEDSAPATQPVEVKLVGQNTKAAVVATGLLAPVIYPLSQAGVVFVVLFFLLLERDTVGHRLRWFIRRRHMGISRDTVEQASTSVGRYLRMQLLVNVCYAVLVFITLFFLGVPSAALLAVIGGALRYIPYVGPLVGILLPTALSIAVFPDWYAPLYVVGALLVIEFVTNMLLEPLLYGKGTGVSSLGVVLASIFWGWVWGPMGLLLAMPMTVWVVIVGRYLPGFRSLAVMLSSDSIAEVENDEPDETPEMDEKLPGWAD